LTELLTAAADCPPLLKAMIEYRYVPADGLSL
jgi:hypothetical protein